MSKFYSNVSRLLGILFWCLVLLTIWGMFHAAGGNLHHIQMAFPQVAAIYAALIALF